MKLWKHHSAQDEADRLNEIASERGEAFLTRYGGKISSEWMIAKIWQILNEAPDIYDKTDRFVEAADWVIMQMCGVVENGIIPGYYGYEAGQSAVGDIFAWFVEYGVPESVKQEAAAAGISVHTLLEHKAAAYKPGETGLLAWTGGTATARYSWTRT